MAIDTLENKGKQDSRVGRGRQEAIDTLENKGKQDSRVGRGRQETVDTLENKKRQDSWVTKAAQLHNNTEDHTIDIDIRKEYIWLT